VEPATQLHSDATARVWRWILILYLVGILVDFALHVRFYLTTGDREIESYEWITGLQASLFWPIDLLAQALLALR
jgi:hypothetical protein